MINSRALGLLNLWSKEIKLVRRKCLFCNFAPNKKMIKRPQFSAMTNPNFLFIAWFRLYLYFIELIHFIQQCMHETLQEVVGCRGYFDYMKIWDTLNQEVSASGCHNYQDSVQSNESLLSSLKIKEDLPYF